jgi:hypothetical protein
MTLLSMYKRDDSRTVYRILAREAVHHLDHPKPGTESKILFTNLARLLERYRYDAFAYNVAPGILEVFKTQTDTAGMEYGEPDETAVPEVLPALQAAHARVYETLTREDLVRSLKRLLAQLATSNVADDEQTKEELAKARLFFVALSEGLKEPHT